MYHLRELEVYRMAHITAVTTTTNQSTIGDASAGGSSSSRSSNNSSSSSSSNSGHGNNVDIFMSHDWPSGVWEYGDKQRLLRSKPYFQEDMVSGKLGSFPLHECLSASSITHYTPTHNPVTPSTLFFPNTVHTPHTSPAQILTSPQAAPP